MQSPSKSIPPEEVVVRRELLPTSTDVEEIEQQNKVSPPESEPMLSEAVVALEHDTVNHLPSKLAISPPPVQKSRPKRNLMQNLGSLALVALSLGTLIIAGVVGLLSYLWFADYTSKTWHSIIVHSWLTKLVTISSLVLRHIVDLQAGFCTAMLAALTLEVIGVRLASAAQGSLMRAQPSSRNIYSLTYILTQGPAKRLTRKAYVVFLTSVLALTTGLIQLTSVSLISDVGIGLIPGPSINSSIGYSRDIKTDAFDSLLPAGTSRTTWVRKPGSYPPFAEYSEPRVLQDGVDDTGLTLRAFLPLSTSQQREELRTFSGKTTVLDSRVSCQAPLLRNVQVLVVDELWGNAITGQVWATQQVPRMDNSTTRSSAADEFKIQHNNTGVPFSCIIFGDDNDSYEHNQEWKTSICQLDQGGSFGFDSFSGTLISEFVDTEVFRQAGFAKHGTSYLVLNLTAGQWTDWLPANFSGNGPVRPASTERRGPWMDLVYGADIYDGEGPTIISISLCYSSFNTSILDVSITSDHQRVEPQESYNFTEAIYSFKSARNQFGQGNSTFEDRGILALERKESWIASESGVWWWNPTTAQDFSDLGGSNMDGNTGNYTAPLWLSSVQVNQQYVPSEYMFTVPHHSHILLFQEIVQNGGSIAYAIQSILTVLAGLDFYDHLPAFNVTSAVQQSSFVSVNTPLRFRGFLAVLTVLAVHLLVCLNISLIFVSQTGWSELGNEWQAIAQVICSETAEILTKASDATKRDVDKMLAIDGKAGDIVILAESNESGRSGLQRAQTTLSKEGP